MTYQSTVAFKCLLCDAHTQIWKFEVWSLESLGLALVSVGVEGEVNGVQTMIATRGKDLERKSNGAVEMVINSVLMSFFPSGVTRKFYQRGFLLVSIYFTFFYCMTMCICEALWVCLVYEKCYKNKVALPCLIKLNIIQNYVVFYTCLYSVAVLG